MHTHVPTFVGIDASIRLKGPRIIGSSGVVAGGPICYYWAPISQESSHAVILATSILILYGSVCRSLLLRAIADFGSKRVLHAAPK